jgi:hypothetical protein
MKRGNSRGEANAYKACYAVTGIFGRTRVQDEIQQAFTNSESNSQNPGAGKKKEKE